MSLPKFNFSITPIFTLSEDGIISTIMKIDNKIFLFDCGIDETLSPITIEKYKKELYDTKIDAIFISNNYLSYFGALPIIKSFPKIKDTPVYATTPIAKLGYFTITDSYISALESSVIKFNKEKKDNLSKIFFSIKDVIYEQNIKISTDNEPSKVINIIPNKSGYSLGGTVWKISYKLNNWLYCPEFSVEPKEIITPFNYHIYKGVNYVITGTLFNDNLCAFKSIFEIEFERKLNENMKKNRNIFIPCDSVNMTLELIIRLEKILEEYNNNVSQQNNNQINNMSINNNTEISTQPNIQMNNMLNPTMVNNNNLIPNVVNNNNNPIPPQNQNLNIKLNSEYKILVCGFCSNEITEGVKRIMEFMGASIKELFRSYNDSSFNFKWIECIKSYEEYQDIISKKNEGVLLQNNSYITLASSEFLTLGISHMILPKILNDEKSTMMIVKTEIKEGSVLEEVVSKYFTTEKVIEYEQRNIIEKFTNDLEIKEKELQKEENKKKMEDKLAEDEIKKEKDFANLLKKKLFDTKSSYLMFHFSKKNKFSDYGIELSEKDLSMMKNSKYLGKENFISNFKNWNLNENNEKQNNENLMKYELPTKVSIEKVNLQIKCEILFFDLFSKIDLTSKAIILNEMKIKNEIIFLGELSEQEAVENLSSKFEQKFSVLKTNETYAKEVESRIIKFKYDSSVFFKSKSCYIFNGENNFKIFEIQPMLLKLKRNRDKNIFEVTSFENDSIDNNTQQLLDPQSQPENNNTINNKQNQIHPVLNYTKDDCETLYSRGQIRLTDIKKHLEKILDEEFFILNHEIHNNERNVKIKLEKGELVLDGKFSPQFFKIRNLIYDYLLINSTENKINK